MSDRLSANICREHRDPSHLECVAAKADDLRADLAYLAPMPLDFRYHPAGFFQLCA
jgi:hypothetical protein